MKIYYKQQSDSEYTEIEKELPNTKQENVSEKITNLTKLTEYNVYVEIYDMKNNITKIEETEVSTGEGDSVDSWLACINNTNEAGYTDDNLDELLANDELRSTLFASDTACQYLAKSTKVLMPAVIEYADKDHRTLTRKINQTIEVCYNRVKYASCDLSEGVYLIRVTRTRKYEY